MVVHKFLGPCNIHCAAGPPRLSSRGGSCAVALVTTAANRTGSCNKRSQHYKNPECKGAFKAKAFFTKIDTYIHLTRNEGPCTGPKSFVSVFLVNFLATLIEPPRGWGKLPGDGLGRAERPKPLQKCQNGQVLRSLKIMKF